MKTFFQSYLLSYLFFAVLIFLALPMLGVEAVASFFDWQEQRTLARRQHAPCQRCFGDGRSSKILERNQLRRDIYQRCAACNGRGYA